MLVQCFYHLEDFAGLTKLIDVLTEGQALLMDIGAKLQSVGLCSEAVAAYLKVCRALPQHNMLRCKVIKELG